VVDASPNRPFTGVVEKIEPQAVIQQNVTMFPVLVTLDNGEGLLKPGMNGETSVLVDQRLGVLAVPNDAVRNTREAVATAPILGLDPDSVRVQVAAQQSAMRGNRGGAGGAGPTGTPSGATRGVSRGDVSLGAQQGGFQMPDVSDKDCAAVDAALRKKPMEKKRLDDLRDQMRGGTGDRQAIRAEMEKIYAAVGVDARVAGACRRREMQQQGAAPGAQVPSAPQRGADTRRAPGAGLTIGAAETGGGVSRRSRPGLVFVKKGASFEPRVIMLGAANFDYSEVVSGLSEGEEVAMLTAAAMQAQRQQQNDRMRQNTGVPGMQSTQPAGQRAAGGAASGGAARTGGGGR